MDAVLAAGGLAAPRIIPSVAAGASTSGFPSPAADFAGLRLSLDEHLIEHWQATFFLQAGDDHPDLGIQASDILVVDRAITPRDGVIVIATFDDELRLCQLHRRQEGILLRSGKPGTLDVLLNEERELSVWGVVRWAIHRL